MLTFISTPARKRRRRASANDPPRVEPVHGRNCVCRRYEPDLAGPAVDERGASFPSRCYVERTPRKQWSASWSTLATPAAATGASSSDRRRFWAGPGSAMCCIGYSRLPAGARAQCWS